MIVNDGSGKEDLVGLFAAEKKKAKAEGKNCHAKTMWSQEKLI